MTPNGWKDREEELREAARVAHLEAEARFRLDQGRMLDHEARLFAAARNRHQSLPKHVAFDAFRSMTRSGGATEKPRSSPFGPKEEIVGVEAIIPATRAAGKNVGVVAQVHFYLDDIFPQGIGRPLLGY